MFAEGNFGRKFNASNYNITVPFGALVEKAAKGRLMQLKAKYPNAVFTMYR